MDHVRGSSLVWPATIEALRPFVLTWWSGRTVDDMPDDVRTVYDASNVRGKHINVALVILDSKGQHLRSAVPRVKPGDNRFDPESQGRDFKAQLDELLKRLTLPKVDKPAKLKLALPEVCDAGTPAGVRIFLTAEKNRLNHYRTPIVEAVPLGLATRKALTLPTAATTLTADDLKPWLEQMYPAAIMDGLGGFKSIDGKLSFKPAGADKTHRYAVIEGPVDFELDNTARTRYRGELAIALKYAIGDSSLESLRGVCEFTVTKGTEKIRLAAAIESTPE